MREVKVDKNEFLEIVRANREAHSEAFQEAIAGYRQACIEELSTLLADIDAGGEIPRYIFRDLPEPKDNTSDYDRAIRMAELSVDNELTLDEHEFSDYILDEWTWKREFLAASSTYGTFPR